MYYPEPNPVYPDNPYPNSISCLRATTGLSQEAFARYCGIGYGTMKKYDRGEQKVSPENKKKIEDATFEKVVLYYEDEVEIPVKKYTIEEIINKFKKEYNKNPDLFNDLVDKDIPKMLEQMLKEIDICLKK